MDYCRRLRPDWARIWGPALEAHVRDLVVVGRVGRLTNNHDDALMNRILKQNWPNRSPDYGRIEAPMLAIVPDGSFHPLLPLEADEALRQVANRFWLEKRQPWIRRRTEVFRQSCPAAHIVELDTPFHHIFLAEEEKTAGAILAFSEAKL